MTLGLDTLGGLTIEGVGVEGKPRQQVSRQLAFRAPSPAPGVTAPGSADLAAALTLMSPSASTVSSPTAGSSGSVGSVSPGGATGGGAGSGGGGSETVSGGLPNLGGYTSDELSAMLDYIAATTGLTVSQLSQQAGSLGDAVRNMLGTLQEQYQVAADQAQANALNRGLFHSGIFAKNVGKLGETRTREESKVRGEAASQLADLQTALDQLIAQQALQAAQAASDINQANLSAAEKAALQNRLDELGLGNITDVDLSKLVNERAGTTVL